MLLNCSRIVHFNWQDSMVEWNAWKKACRVCGRQKPKHSCVLRHAYIVIVEEIELPNETKQDFCCLIVSGFGAGEQAGIILRDHLRDNGMDAFLTTPSGQETLRISQEHWVHGVRMEYLSLRRRYRRIALIGVSLGGMLLVHLLDLNPAAVVFVNAPCMHPYKNKERNYIFQADLRPRMHGVIRETCGKHQLRRLAAETRSCGVQNVSCPALVLQTLDDRVSDPSNADRLFKQLHVADKNIRFYPEGGHDVLTSRAVLAVCSDIFQFCSRVRGGTAVADTTQ